MSDKEELIEDFEEEESSTDEAGSGVFQQYGKTAGIILVSLLVVIGGYVYWKYTSNENTKKANIALTRVLPLYEMNDYERALNGDARINVGGQALIGMKEISDKYGSTGAGKMAALYTGQCYIGTNKFKEAIPYFEKALSADSKLITSGANAGIGVCYEAEGKHNEAGEAFEKASDLSDMDNVKVRYSLFAAMNYEKSNNKEKAIKLYKFVVGLGPLTEFAGSAKSGLVRLGTIID